jgi:hypothetical protein
MGLIVALVQFWLITGITVSVLAMPFVLLGSLGNGTGGSTWRPSPRVNWSRTDSRPVAPPAPKPQRIVFWWIGRDQGP